MRLWKKEKTYSLKRNYAKCEAVTYYNIDKIKFRNGETVKEVDEAKYLGCMLNDEAQASKEIN